MADEQLEARCFGDLFDDIIFENRSHVDFKLLALLFDHLGGALGDGVAAETLHHAAKPGESNTS